MAIEAHVHRLSSGEYRRMVETGALDELRVELLGGLLVDRSPQGERHARVIQQLMRLFAGRMDLLRVAVSSQSIDRRKALVYARAGVPRYWLVDLPAGVVRVHSEPGADGYAAVATRRGADVLDAGVEGTEQTTVDALLAI